jgi:hypothetical protein
MSELKEFLFTRQVTCYEYATIQATDREDARAKLVDYKGENADLERDHHGEWVEV